MPQFQSRPYKWSETQTQDSITLYPYPNSKTFPIWAIVIIAISFGCMVLLALNELWRRWKRKREDYLIRNGITTATYYVNSFSSTNDEQQQQQDENLKKATNNISQVKTESTEKSLAVITKIFGLPTRIGKHGNKKSGEVGNPTSKSEIVQMESILEKGIC
ncbi:hypothetical protein G9A89_008860 [Geosiphon pyriformis]|nr:hypothetical protein G9A89_008860 [Geosiphon pyriformis]